MSRFDETGMMWEDIQVRRERTWGRRVRNVTVPETGWLAPTELPNIPAHCTIALDTETCDEGLQAGTGPGGVKGQGYVAGVSIACDDQAWYFPMQHEGHVCPDLNIHAWLRDVLSTDRLVVGHNLLYDLEWLRAECVVAAPCVRLFDTMMAAAMLDENRLTYDLDNVAQDALGERKEDSLLYQWLSATYGGKATRGEQAGRIHQAPPSLVGPYAEQDARLPLRLYEVQREQLLAEKLGDIAAMEFGLLPLLLDMRFKGVRVDIEEAQRVKETLALRVAEMSAQLKQLSGRSVDVWAADSVVRALRAAGETRFPLSPTGKVSVTKQWLESHPSKVARYVTDIRRLDKLINTFLDGYVLASHNDGRVHCQFHPLKTDGSGTVSGRFSSSNPNLQNIPARDEEANRLLRGLYVPDDESHVWHSLDYSQIEYRLLAHHAVGPGADVIRRRYNEDPTTDYHDATGEQIKHDAGVSLERKAVKGINFGLAYGMGKAALASHLGVDAETAEYLFDNYHRALPFVSRTFQAAETEARRTGVVRTFMGRVCRFPWFEDSDGKLLRVQKPGSRRANTHKSLNRRLQGGAADVMKRAMLLCHRAGLPVPLITVHDELDYSAPTDSKELAEVREVMEHCVTLKVPLLVKHVRGRTWGDCA